MKKWIPRRAFLNKLFLLILLPLWYLWDSEVSRSLVFGKRELVIKLPSTLPQGISFFDRVIVVRKVQEIKVFSSLCSHLGCIISKAENEVIICPCHGSRYSMDGEVLNGPAAKPLKSLEYTLNKDKGTLSVKV